MPDRLSVEPRVAEDSQPPDHNYSRAAVMFPITADPPSSATTADPPSTATTADLPSTATTAYPPSTATSADPPRQEKVPRIMIFLPPLVVGKKGEAVKIVSPADVGNVPPVPTNLAICDNSAPRPARPARVLSLLY